MATEALAAEAGSEALATEVGSVGSAFDVLCRLPAEALAVGFFHAG